MEKKEFSEADVCDLFITPALKTVGWDTTRQIRREVTLTPGPVIVRGNLSSRNKKARKYADYVLSWESGVPVAVIEAKGWQHAVGQGLQQALAYAAMLEVPSAFSSNGQAFASHNGAPLQGEDVETELALEAFPTPAELWDRYKRFRGIPGNHDMVLAQPYHDDFSGKQPRYYQVDAVNHAVEAVASGERRILLVMATGTGKTYTTFQIIWRLWKAGAVRRVLFLADRNILIDQTLVNDFKPFGPVMTKIRNRKIDPAYQIYLGLYQAITGSTEEDKIFKNVPPNFFDLIVIDECHRGSASDDAAWREILDYFEGAIQIGLTATPAETRYASSSKYFGPPVYTYSLQQGIQDGFLAPYKVVRIDIDKDVLGWEPLAGMKDDLGHDIAQREYGRSDMDRTLVLDQRTQLVARRVIQFLKATNPFDKTIVFCEDIEHAERMRAALVNAAGELALANPRYVMRITGDSVEGKAELDNFIDPASRFPVIATTSELLTTGVDVKTCKLIVLDKTIASMTAFKQIIGRGTRIDEEHDKWFFTIMDFKNATALFRDPLFDGYPVVEHVPTDEDSLVPPDPVYPDDVQTDVQLAQASPAGRKLRVSGVPAAIVAERIQYRGPDGSLISESYRDFTRRQIRSEYASLDAFVTRWNAARRKQAIIDELEERGIVLENLAAEVGSDYGDFDLICHIAFDQLPLTRLERVKRARQRHPFASYGGKAQAVLDALLDKYADEGIGSVESPKILRLEPFRSMGTPVEIIREAFGGRAGFDNAIYELENELFRQSERA